MNLMPLARRTSGPIPEDRAPEVFALSQNDIASDLWRRLNRELQKRLVSKREENDGQLDEAQTARVRGHLECLKSILELGAEPPPLQE